MVHINMTGSTIIRSLKANTVPSQVATNIAPPPAPHLHVDRPPVTEESSVRPPDYKYKQTKLISITESVQLIDDQRTRNEVLSRCSMHHLLTLKKV